MTNHPIAAIVCALIASLLIAVAAVAQQRAAAAVPTDTALMGTLLRNPRWWAGIGGDAGGYAMQVVALAFGAVLVVQPILVSALVFALPLAAWLNGQRISARAATAALILCAALALFLIVGNPTVGEDNAPFREWLVPLAILLGIVAVATLVGLVITDRSGRALALGLAGGALFGLAAALTDRVVALFGDGLGAVLSGWQTWALVAAGLLGLYLQQRAFQVGPLSASLPAATIAEPLAAAFLGLTALGEHLRTDGAGLLVVVICVVVMCVATVALCRTSAVARTGADEQVR
ncbi:DMT family transporter [Nocardia mangyaensis]|uniref:DMT family transporter n=1 Tax=Nocardia mangyaensis TaxID=2213200 RepID=UPI002674D77A|nr:DMT family transporter [Nocardia mangyaensis]MDO3646989.1 DMT family transporter [Nocardia mangyaensis]